MFIKMLNTKFQIISTRFCRKIVKNNNLLQLNVKRCLSINSKETSNQSYYHSIGKTPLVYRNIGQELERVVSEYGSTEAIVSCHENKRYTFQSLIDEVDRLAAGFFKIGLKRGDHLGIWAPNNLHWYLTMLAASRVGLVSVGINPAFQAPEVKYCLNKVNVKAIVAPEHYKSQNYYEILKSICPEISNSENGRINSKTVPSLQNVIIDTSTSLKGVLSFNELLDLCDGTEAKKISQLQRTISPDSACNVQFTSGTTGQPKATMLSHFNFVNNGIHIGTHYELRGQRVCVHVPLFHVFGCVHTVTGSMSQGATMVLAAAGFQPEASLEAIVNEKCTVLYGTPTMFVDLIKKQKELKFPLKTLKMAVTGGAPCSPELFLNIKEYLCLEQVRSVYGMTEATAVIFQSRKGDTIDQVLNTVGQLQDHIEAKVIDEQGNTVPFGQPGELCVKGYVTMLGYYDDELKTREMISVDKWLKTGDQFVLQADGYGRIIGRIKEMIIRGGENLFPKEIEDYLNTHPDIIECHIIGVPDERMGEEVCAFVRLEDGVKHITVDAIKAYCKGTLAHFKVPRYVIPVDSFPTTTSGKIQKFKLLELFKKNNKIL